MSFKNKNDKKFLLISLLITALLSACGGSGGDSPTNDSGQDTVVDAPPENNPPPETNNPPAPAPDPVVLNSITPGQEWLYFKGSQSPGDDWNTINYDDSAWLAGPSGFGYGDGDDATILNDMMGSYLSVYTRKTFQFSSTTTLTSMTLNIDYDDGYIAYLNGVEISRSNNFPDGVIAFNTAAIATHDVGTPINIDLMSFASLLVDGDNVFAIEAHNQSLNSTDLSLIAAIYFNEAAPAAPDNGGGDPTPPPPSGGSGDATGTLAGYTVVGTLNTIDYIGNDLSGITYVPESNRYFMIQNNGGRIWEADINFNLLRTIRMVGMGDTEDIVYMGNNEFAIVNEASRLFIVNIFADTTRLDTSDTANVQTITFGASGGNVGPEGVAFNSATQTFYIVKEQSPRAIYSFPRPGPGNQTITPSIPFDAETVLTMARDLSAITYDPRGGGSLLILSHISHSVVDVDISGNILGVLKLADSTQHEGITLDPQFNLQITSEANFQRTYSLAP